MEQNPRIHVHFTPRSGFWLNLVEVWFGMLERRAICRGAFPTVKDLASKITDFITRAGTSVPTTHLDQDVGGNPDQDQT